MDKTVSIARNSEPAHITLKNFRGKNDGMNNVDIEYDEVFLEMCKLELNKKELTVEDLSFYVTGLIDKATNGIDGYRIDVEN